MGGGGCDATQLGVCAGSLFFDTAEGIRSEGVFGWVGVGVGAVG